MYHPAPRYIPLIQRIRSDLAKNNMLSTKEWVIYNETKKAYPEWWASTEPNGALY